jgi:hypothetical protein
MPVSTVEQADQHRQRSGRLNRHSISENERRNDDLSARHAQDTANRTDEEAEQQARDDARCCMQRQKSYGCDFNESLDDHAEAEDHQQHKDDPADGLH